MYGRETAAMARKQETQLDRAEIRISRFSWETGKDKIRNEHIKAEMVGSCETWKFAGRKVLGMQMPRKRNGEGQRGGIWMW